MPAAYLLLAAVYLGPLSLYPGGVAFPPGSQFTDLLVSHLPNAAYVRGALAAGHGVPLWNTQILAGQPFAADPLAGVWYPPNWLLFVPLLPLPLAFNLLTWLHMTGAGLGMNRVLLAHGLPLGPAFLGGAVLAGLPKLVAHVGAGHVSLVYAVAWTPWLLLAVHGMVRRGGWQAGALAGACLTLTFLADVRWAYYAGVLAALQWAALVASGLRPANSGQLITGAGTPQHLKPILIAAVALPLMAAALAAALALPFAEFVSHSSRAVMSLADAAEFSLPVRYLVGLLIPDLGGFHEWMTYCGVGTLLLAVLGVGRRTWFWLAAALLAVAFALGENFVVYPLLFRLAPGVGLLRVPPRALFVTGLALSILAAHGAHRLFDRVLPWLAERYPGLTRLRRAALPGMAVLVALVALDVTRVNWTLLEVRPIPALAPAAAWLHGQPEIFRVYSPSYSLPAGDQLDHLDGVNPLQLAASVALIDAAAGVPRTRYSVTVPAELFAAGSAPDAGSMPDADLLGLFNVRYVAADFRLAAPGLSLVQSLGVTQVYANSAAKERVWMADAAPDASAELVLLSPDRLEASVVGPGRVVFSEVMYPGWRASLGGQPVTLEPWHGVFRSLVVPSGSHQVVLAYQPSSVMVGLSISGLGLSILALGALREWRERRVA